VVMAADDPDDMPTQSSTAQPAKPAKPVDKVIRVSQDITDLACWPPSADRDSFVGSRSVRSTDGRNVIDQQIGMRGTDRLILKSFGDLRLCMVAEGIGDRDWSVPPSQWISRARRVVMEAQRGTSLQRMEIEGGRTLWSVASRAQTADAAADQWRDRMLAVFDTTWEISSLRGRESSLRGQISSIRGQESSLRGQISSYRGIVSSYRGQISSIQGGESSLRGEISAIQGRESSLRGAISSERGAISSLRASDYRSTAADRARIDEMVKRHEDRITIIERQLREFNAPARIAAVEKQIAAGEVDRKIAAVEAEIRAFDVDGKVAAIEKQIAELDVTGKVAAIEREIAALDADRRVRDLEQRRDAQLATLEKTLAAIK
jgi:chromosome segregation ATPase